MIEFTMSRIALCICGTVLLAAAVCAMDGLRDQMEMELGGNLTEDITGMLDAYWESESEILTLDGFRILPSPDHILVVESNVVRLMGPEGEHTAVTLCGLDFELTYHGTVILDKSIPEYLGDVTYGIGERIDVGKVVVQVRRSPGAALQSTVHVERMCTVHA